MHITIIDMRKSLANYNAPSVEVVETVVEHGFTVSNSTGEDWNYGEIEG